MLFFQVIPKRASVLISRKYFKLNNAGIRTLNVIKFKIINTKNNFT